MFDCLKAYYRAAAKEFGQTFRSLNNRNYRLYSTGQLISVTGTWMQSVALSWTTYSLAHSASILGLVGFTSNLPVLLFGLWAGSLADHYNRRKVLITTQMLSMLGAAVLAALAFHDGLQVWIIMAFTLLAGTISAFENPARQAFVSDLVRGQDMVNAVGLNSVIFQTTRLLGPALAAILLAHFGVSVCFALNCLSFLASLIALYRIRIASDINTGVAEPAKKRPSIKEGIAVARKTPAIRNILLLTAVTSFFVFQIFVLLPVFVGEVLHAKAGALGLLTASSAAGALVGALFMAARGKGPFLRRWAGLANLGLSVAMLAFALSTKLYLSAAIEVFIGLCMTLQMSSSNSLLQLTAPPEFRGRIMSMYTMLLFGVAPLGNLVMGRLADSIGAPHTLMLAAFVCAVSSGVYLLVTRGDQQDRE